MCQTTKTYMNADLKIALTELLQRLRTYENLIQNNGAFADIWTIDEAYNLVKDGVIFVDAIQHEQDRARRMADFLTCKRIAFEDCLYGMQPTASHIHKLVKDLYIGTLPRHRIPERISLLDQAHSYLNLYIEITDQVLRENNAYYTVSADEDEREQYGGASGTTKCAEADGYVEQETDTC